MGDPGVALADLPLAAPRDAALALRHWLQAANLPPPERDPLFEFLRQLAAASRRGRPRLLCSAYTLQRYREAIYLLPTPRSRADGSLPALGPGEELLLSGCAGQLRLAPAQAQGLRLARGERLQVRRRTGGERCRPQGRPGSVSLKKLLQELGVPPWWRDQVPLLYLQGELVAVADLVPCESRHWVWAPGDGEMLWRPVWERNITTAFD
jgi:tRNA(Ile)-lysidine synthase